MLKQSTFCVNPIAAVTRPSLRLPRHCVRLPGATPSAPPFQRNAVPAFSRHVTCSAEAESPSDSPPSKGMIDYVLGQGVYQLLTGALSVISVSVIFASPRVSEILFGISLTPVGDLGYRGLGSLVLIVAATCYCMQSAVGANRLDSPTYKRLSFALAFSLGTMLICKLIAVSQGFAMAAPGLYGTSVIQLLPSIAFLKLYGLSTMPDIIPGMISGVTSLFQPDNINAALYSLFSVITMVFAIVAVVNPGGMASIMLVHPADAFVRFVMQAVGAVSYLVSIVCFTLKDAADRGRLGFTTFKILNTGVCLASVAKIATSYYVCRTAPATAAGAEQCLFTRVSWIAIIGLYGTLALVSGFNAITAKKE